MQIRIIVIVMICLLNCLGATQAQNLKPLDLINAQKKLLVPSSFNPFTLNDSRNVIPLPSDIQNPILLNLNKTTLRDLLVSNAGLISISIPSSDRNTLTLNLTPVDVMEKGGKVMLAPSGEEAILTQGKHYRGVISGDDKSLVAISVFDDEIMGFIAGEQIIGNLVLGRLENSDVHILYQDEEINHHFHFECSTPDSGEIYTRDQLNGPKEGSRSLTDCVRLYLEVDFDIYTGKGSSVIATTNYITGVFNQVSTLYANENLNTIVSEIVIWMQNSPYNGTTSLAMLNAFTAHRQGFNGDLAQLLSYKASGGVAYLDGLCRTNPDFSMSFSSIHSTYQNVPTYSWTVEVCAHEFGHLFGSQHTHACAWNGNGTAIDGCYATEGGCPNPGLPQGGGTVMSYCHLTNVGINFANGFGTQPGNIMRSKVTNANCLQTCEGGGNECTDNEVILTIRVDNYPSETTWNLKNSSNVIIYSGGPYTGAGSTKIENFCLIDGCYTFTIFDSYGDGICCNYGQGFYHVKKGTTILAEGGQFGSSQIHNFCVTNNSEPSCTDGIQNGQETGIDCGGPTCPACPTCNDGIQNGQETGVDCGGPTCPACPTCTDGIQNGQETGVDCGGPTCQACPTCNDGIQNGQETGVDCGGPTCPACPTCNDGIQNGNETGIDCGGSCPPCNTINISGHYFETGWDGWQSGGSNAVRYTGSLSPEGNSSIRIASNSPTTSIFTSPIYNLAAYNTVTVEFMFRATSMETGEDFWLRYFNGTTWTTIAQYVSGTDFNNNIVYTRTVTINGPFSSNARFRFHNDAGDTSDRVYIDAVRISATTSGNQPTCTDGIQNGQETGVDCGGPTCPACPTCSDGIQNGQETGVDCGGPTCPSCPTCNDGIQNGQETGIDCGGPTCPACATCNDGIQNGQETGVDCGGPTCPACATCNDGIQNGNETGIDCGGNCPPCNSAPVFIGGYYFETGWDGWIDGGAHCFRYGGSISPEGTYSIRLRNTGLESSMTSPSYNLNGYQSVNVEFMFRTSGVEAGKSFVLQYFNGTTYSTVATFVSGDHFVNNVNYTTNVTLTGSFSANSKFRFENGGTDNSDFVFLDGIVIHAMNGSSLIENPISITKSDQILEEYIVENEFKIYPNPTTHILNVEVADTPSKIRIINALGEEMMNLIVSNQTETIDISHLPSGIFIIVSENGSGVESKKLIKH